MPHNDPITIQARYRVILFISTIYELCTRHRASVTSWIRSPARNNHVKGSPRSLHLEGLAADLVLDDPNDAERLIADARALGLEAANEQHHVHLEYDYRSPETP